MSRTMHTKIIDTKITLYEVYKRHIHVIYSRPELFFDEVMVGIVQTHIGDDKEMTERIYRTMSLSLDFIRPINSDLHNLMCELSSDLLWPSMFGEFNESILTCIKWKFIGDLTTIFSMPTAFQTLAKIGFELVVQKPIRIAKRMSMFVDDAQLITEIAKHVDKVFKVTREELHNNEDCIRQGSQMDLPEGFLDSFLEPGFSDSLKQDITNEFIRMNPTRN